MKISRHNCMRLIAFVFLSLVTIAIAIYRERIPNNISSISADIDEDVSPTPDVQLVDIDALYARGRILRELDNGAETIVGLTKTDMNVDTPTALWVIYSPMAQGHQTCRVSIEAWQVNSSLDSLRVSLSGRIDRWGRERAEEILKLFFNAALLSNDGQLGSTDYSRDFSVENNVWSAHWNPGLKIAKLNIKRK